MIFSSQRFFWLCQIFPIISILEVFLELLLFEFLINFEKNQNTYTFTTFLNHKQVFVISYDKSQRSFTWLTDFPGNLPWWSSRVLRRRSWFLWWLSWSSRGPPGGPCPRTCRAYYGCHQTSSWSRWCGYWWSRKPGGPSETDTAVENISQR